MMPCTFLRERVIIMYRSKEKQMFSNNIIKLWLKTVDFFPGVAIFYDIE